MLEEPSIKIVISCHKEIDYPKSDVYLPIHLGASSASNPLPGMQPDDEGDNISARNFTYCELTAQYWAWKHLDTDYIGQCHYRRYFYFGSGKHKANDHLQIEVPNLSPASIHEFQLEDSSLIREIVAQHDVVVAPQWDVSKAPTPCGMKATVREHMVSYGLMLDEDVDRLIEITRHLKPEYVDGLVGYLNGKSYRGYNCFIMRKGLFHRLCDFEFPILQEFDASFDYDNMRTTRKRICGYFAEILYSVFVNQLIAEGGHDIVERPLLFFDDTSRLYSFENASESADIHVIWRFDDPCVGCLAPAVDSLVEHLDPERSYALTIVHDQHFSFADFKRLLQRIPGNLALDDAVYPTLDCVPAAAGLGDEELFALLPLLMLASDVPGARKGQRVLWIDGISVFDRDPLELFHDDSASGLASMSGLFLQRELNRPQSKELSDTYYAAVGGKRVWHDCSVLLFDESKMGQLDRQQIIGAFREISDEMDIPFEQLMKDRREDFTNVKEFLGVDRDRFVMPVERQMVLSALLERLGASTLPLRDTYPVMNELEARTWCNEIDAKALASTCDAVLYHFSAEAEPLSDLLGSHARLYWHHARASAAYEMLMTLVCERPPRGKSSLKNRLFPPFSRRRRFLGKIRRLL